MKRFLFIAVAALMLFGCKDSGRTLPSATGSIYEMLIVMDKQQWDDELGQTVRATIGADMPCLPQIEQYFNVSQVTPQMFDNFLMPTRNILIFDVNSDRYTQVKIRYMRDVYSRPQAMCRVQAPSWEALAQQLSAEQLQTIRSWFVRQELDRQGSFYRNYKTEPTREAVQHRFGADIWIPADYILVRDNEQLVWCVNDGGSLRRDLIIWSYPYTSEEQLTPEALLQKRDEVLGQNVSGSLDGTFMGTEYKHIPPEYSVININNRWCAEIRGLWKMQGGEAMGGPFVELTRVDEINQRVVTAEVFVFAPGQKKRNALRQAEAILYTLKLPQELMLEQP